MSLFAALCLVAAVAAWSRVAPGDDSLTWIAGVCLICVGFLLVMS
jgi:hypothetical protein